MYVPVFCVLSDHLDDAFMVVRATTADDDDDDKF